MKAHQYRTITRATILAITIASSASLSFADEATAGFDDDFFALDGVYDFSRANETPQAQFERTSISSRLLSTSYSGWSETAAGGESELAEPSTFAGATGQSNISQRPPVISGQPFRVRPFGDDLQSGLFKTLGVGMFLASGADLASTEIGLNRPGIAELNPTQQNRAVRLSTHVAAPALVWWLSENVRRGGKPKLALFMRIGFAVAHSYAVMHNVRTMERALERNVTREENGS